VKQATGEVLWAGEHKEHADTSAVSFSTGLRASWELDFWGKFQRGIEAADAGYWASIALYDDVQVLMASQVASLYISIRTVKVRLRIAAENAALQKRNLDISERLFKSGQDSARRAAGQVAVPRDAGDDSRARDRRAPGA
jgi:outer membrane protein TolC